MLSFVMQITEITRALTLLFSLLCLKADTPMRLEVCTLLLSPVSFFRISKLTKTDAKPKMFPLVVSVLVILLMILKIHRL